MGAEDPFSKDAATRVARFLASGESPEGYQFSSQKLKDVIRATPGVNDEFKEKVIMSLEEKVIKGQQRADVYRVGLTLAAMSNEVEGREDLYKIMNEVNDLDKLPIVSIRGKSVQ